MLEEARTQILQAGSTDALQAVKTHYLGKNGEVTKQLKTLGTLSPEERKAKGQEINVLKQEIDALISARETELKEAALQAKLASEAIDVTLPALSLPSGGLHIITRILDDLSDIFTRMAERRVPQVMGERSRSGDRSKIVR